MNTTDPKDLPPIDDVTPILVGGAPMSEQDVDKIAEAISTRMMSLLVNDQHERLKDVEPIAVNLPPELDHLAKRANVEECCSKEEFHQLDKVAETIAKFIIRHLDAPRPRIFDPYIKQFALEKAIEALPKEPVKEQLAYAREYVAFMTEEEPKA
jgi:hypothetical protein